MSTKILVAIVAVVAIAGGAYYVLSQGGSSQNAAIEQVDIGYPIPESNTSATAANGMPQATDSVDDFSAAIDADLQASASAVSSIDAQDDASVSAVQTAGSNSNLYDPNNL